MTSKVFSLEALRSFMAICETGSFRRAAAQVHKSPSAVSLHIHRLEELLDVRLLERDARHVALTGQGEMLRGQARRLLGLNDETLAMFQESPLVGTLFLAASHDLGMTFVPSLLRRLAEIHPNVHVDVQLCSSDIAHQRLMAGSANLALFYGVGPSRIPARDLFSEPLIWLALDGGRAIEKKPLPLAVAVTGCAWRDAALNALRLSDKAFRLAYSSDTAMGQMAAIRADLAIAALPRSLANRDLVEAASHHALPELPRTYIRLADDGSELARTFAAWVATDMLPSRRTLHWTHAQQSPVESSF